MRLTLRDNLPFVSLRAVYHGKELAADVVASLGIMAEPGDMLHAVRGEGGYEYVFDRQLDHLQLGTRHLANITVEISGLDYGFPINGILGMDFLTRTGAILNLQALSLEFA